MQEQGVKNIIESSVQTGTNSTVFSLFPALKRHFLAVSPPRHCLPHSHRPTPRPYSFCSESSCDQLPQGPHPYLSLVRKYELFFNWVCRGWSISTYWYKFYKCSHFPTIERHFLVVDSPWHCSTHSHRLAPRPYSFCLELSCDQLSQGPRHYLSLVRKYQMFLIETVGGVWGATSVTARHPTWYDKT